MEDKLKSLEPLVAKLTMPPTKLIISEEAKRFAQDIFPVALDDPRSLPNDLQQDAYERNLAKQEHQDKVAEACQLLIDAAKEAAYREAAEVEPQVDFEAQFDHQVEINAYVQGYEDAKEAILALIKP